MREYDLFLPLQYNDGSDIEAGKYQKVQSELLKQFDGVTYFPQAIEGLWRVGDVVYRDAIVVFRVVTRKPRAARRFLARFKKRLLRSFKQEDIFIVERNVRLL